MQNLAVFNVDNLSRQQFRAGHVRINRRRIQVAQRLGRRADENNFIQQMLALGAAAQNIVRRNIAKHGVRRVFIVGLRTAATQKIKIHFAERINGREISSDHQRINVAAIGRVALGDNAQRLAGIVGALQNRQRQRFINLFGVADHHRRAANKAVGVVNKINMPRAGRGIQQLLQVAAIAAVIIQIFRQPLQPPRSNFAAAVAVKGGGRRQPPLHPRRLVKGITQQHRPPAHRLNKAAVKVKFFAQQVKAADGKNRVVEKIALIHFLAQLLKNLDAFVVGQRKRKSKGDSARLIAVKQLVKHSGHRIAPPWPAADSAEGIAVNVPMTMSSFFWAVLVLRSSRQSKVCRSSVSTTPSQARPPKLAVSKISSAVTAQFNKIRIFISPALYPAPPLSAQTCGKNMQILMSAEN